MRAALCAIVTVTFWSGVITAQSMPGVPGASSAQIRFVRSLDPSTARGKPSVFSRVLKVIVGGADQQILAQPYGVAVGPDNQLYVADSGAGLIHVFGLANQSYRSIHVDSASLIGVAFLGQRMVVTDSVDGRVLCLDLKGKTLWTLGRKDGLQRPTGVVAFGDEWFVVDTLAHRIVAVNASGKVRPFAGRRGNGDGEFNFPTHIAADRAGRLYVTDAMNFRVQVLESSGRYLRTFGQIGDGPGDFDKPKGIAVDANGRIYVVEGLNDLVQVFDGDGRLLTMFGGSGSGPGQLWLPAGITLAGSAVYVADSANRRVQVYERLGDAR